ncbi:T9SS type A sorting domain-containing protein, partial [candidate division WOR-3 bacterium]|nr:T9SS type A sorting domain-containing protein [candidate division WOR-3 bacterium]
AFDIANIIFMDNCGFWLPVYHYNIFGDPALQQFGRTVAVNEQKHDQALTMFTVSPNPSHGNVTITFNCKPARETALTIYDAAGRCIRHYDYPAIGPAEYLVWSGKDAQERTVPTGVYFILLETTEQRAVQRAVQKIVITR